MKFLSDDGVIPRGRRSAALVLHCLDPGDRRWLFHMLPPGARATVSPLLDELGSLGLSDHPGIVRALLGGMDDAHAGRSGPRARIAEATAAEIWAVLQHEPLAMTGWLLALGPWPWRAALIKKLQPHQRAAVAEAEAGWSCVGDTAAIALLDAVETTLPQRKKPGRRHVHRALAWLGRTS